LEGKYYYTSILSQSYNYFSTLLSLQEGAVLHIDVAQHHRLDLEVIIDAVLASLATKTRVFDSAEADYDISLLLSSSA
jgi:hypothetical protein